MVKTRNQHRAGAGSVTLLAIAALIFSLGSTAPAQAQSIPAICQESSGDSGRIQVAIDRSKPGDEVVIKGGRCLITETITLRGGRSYRGESREGTVLTQADGANLPALLASDTWVENTPTTGAPFSLEKLTLDGNRENNPEAGDGLVIRSWNTTVEDVAVRWNTGNGITVTNLSQDGTPVRVTPESGNQVNGTIRNVFVWRSGGANIRIKDTGNTVTDWNLLDSWIAWGAKGGVLMDNAAGWRVEGNHFYGNHPSAINAERMFASSISNNYIEDFDTNGIEVTVQGVIGNTIANNRVFHLNSGTAGTYILIKRANYATGVVGVTGNVVRGNTTGTGLGYEAGSANLTVTSSGNTVVNVAKVMNVGDNVTVSEGV
ncbi:MAG: right-handed parallel beta-helix repeat-containing protein [Stackebrandtia sp.]